jgi:hypothetical protein
MIVTEQNRDDRLVTSLEERVVLDAMLRHPKTLSASATVADVRAAFGNDRVHLAQVVDDEGRLVTTLERSDLLDVPDEAPARSLGRLTGWVVDGLTPLTEVRQSLPVPTWPSLASGTSITTATGWPEPVLHRILDTHGVAIGSVQEVVTIHAWTAEALDEGGTPQVTVWSIGERVSRPQAALTNGTPAHALDFDDVSALIGGHPSAPVLAGALAVTEGCGTSGEEVVAAFVVGFEMEAMGGRPMSHRDRPTRWMLRQAGS